MPIVSKLKDEGTISGYGFQFQALYGDQSWTHRAWYGVPNLGSLDELGAAIDGAMTPEIAARVAEVFNWNERQNDVLMVLHLGGSAGGGEQ